MRFSYEGGRHLLIVFRKDRFLGCNPSGISGGIAPGGGAGRHVVRFLGAGRGILYHGVRRGRDPGLEPGPPLLLLIRTAVRQFVFP